MQTMVEIFSFGLGTHEPIVTQKRDKMVPTERTGKRSKLLEQARGDPFSLSNLFGGEIGEIGDSDGGVHLS